MSKYSYILLDLEEAKKQREKKKIRMKKKKE